MPSTKRKRVPSAKLRAAEEGDSEDNADTVKAIAHSVKAAAKKGKPAAGKADSDADKTSSAAAKDGTGKASAGTAEEGKAKADEGKVRAAVPAFAADSGEGEVTKKGTRVMRAPSWAGVSRQNSGAGAMPEMSLKSFDESMQQLFTGESMMATSEFGFDGDLFDDDYGMDIVPVDGEKPRTDGQEAAGGGGGGGKALKGLRPKLSKLSKGKPKSGVKRSTTADQLAAAQDQLAAMVAEEEDESGGNTDEADEAGEGSEGSEDEDEDEVEGAEEDDGEDGGKSTREDKGCKEVGKKGKNRTAWTELAQEILHTSSLEETMRLLAPESSAPARARRNAPLPKRSDMSVEERQELAKVRNRENARSTRKRRKLYITRLQKLITELSHNLSSQVSSGAPEEAKHAYSKHRSARCEAVQNFFKYRSDGVVDKEKWSRIIDPNFVLTQPPLPFRVYSDFERTGQFYCCRGVEGLVADTAVLRQVMVRIAASRAKRANCSCSVKVVYVVDPGEMLVAMDKLMCKWQVNYQLVVDGKKHQVGHWGMCKCKFSVDNRLASVDLRCLQRTAN